MRKKKILMMLAMLLTAVTGAWAQDEWATVYKQTQTTAANWTALDAGSTTGQTLGSAGNTTYYYVTGNLSFTNSTAGGSGLKIQGTVYLYIPTGTTLTCTGANATATTGAGAGIELTQGNSLYLIGGGTLVATGGNAANGGNGGKAAAVPVRASAHAAAMAELAAAAVNALELIIKRLRNMALMVILAVPVVPLAPWARSMFTRIWPPQ